MLSEGRGYMRQAPWITIAPGLTIMLTVLSVNLLGDGLRDALDPRLRV
jgi:ABC-type dipeptide/oligopeptide/nickel transport system permease subunit